TVQGGEIGDVQILLDVLDGDAPGIAGALEQGFDLVLHPRLFSEVGPVLEVLQLLLEVGTPARLRREPAFGDLKVRHARFVERVEKAAVAAGVARRVAAFQNVERRFSRLAGSAGTGHDFLAPDLAQQLEPRRSPAAPAQVTTLEPGRQVQAAIFEVAGNGHGHDVELLRQVLRPAGTVLQVDVEFVEIRRAAVDDDEPRVIFRLRIEAGEAQGRDVPIEVVAAKTLDDP